MPQNPYFRSVEGDFCKLWCVTCHYGQRGKGPGEEWSYGSKKGRDGEKAKERDSMDYSAPMLAFYPPGININVQTHAHTHTHTQTFCCLLTSNAKRRSTNMHSGFLSCACVCESTCG